MNKGSKVSIYVSVIVAFITGTLAGIPAFLGYMETPKKIEGEFRKIQLQSEAQLKLQRDQQVSQILARLDDPNVYVRAGAALSLSVLGGEEIVPILVGKLKQSSKKIASINNCDRANNEEDIQNEQQFLDSLKQSLLTIGIPSLGPLVDLNRDLRNSSKRFAAFKSREGNGKLENLCKEDKTDFFKKIKEIMRTNDPVKDVITSLLIKATNTEGQDGTLFLLTKNRISLANTDLSYARLIRVNLAGVDLRNADLRNTSLEESNLRNADLSGALLQNSIIQEANFENAKFVGAKMNNIKYFEKVKVKGADFLNAEINNDNLRRYLKGNGALNVP